MQLLAPLLATYPLEMLRVIANRWDVDLPAKTAKEASSALASAMLKAEAAARVWERLPDDERGALQTLLGSKNHQMPAALFTRTYGAIRQVGAEQIQRDKPHLNPAGITEALYYRGLLATGSVKGKADLVPVIYVPHDLAAVLPAKVTGFALNPEPTPPPPTVPAIPEPPNIRMADTMIVDDLATLLVFCRLRPLPLEGGLPSPEQQQAIKQYFIGHYSQARMALLISLMLDMNLAFLNGHMLELIPEKTRAWLEQPRPTQVRLLVEAWRDSRNFQELAYTPGLKLEKTGGWQYDPLLARQTVLGFLESVPPNGWWEVGQMLEDIKENEADFQRPDGDYDSWYIRDEKSGKYLKGFESWDRVEGALLRFLLAGVMHGLGLIDVAKEGTLVRLTAYGRALSDVGEWPKANPEETAIKVNAEGICEVLRAVNRYERFQIARFCEWVSAGDPYIYRISKPTVDAAMQQGLKPDMIVAFLRKLTKDNLPEAVVSRLELWGKPGREMARLSQVIVLRVTSKETMDMILSTPALRRYVGASLGPTACIVREDQWQPLKEALELMGIPVEIDQNPSE
jgi:Helicase conserved C-terminal domain